MSKLKEEEKKNIQAVTGHGTEYPKIIDASSQTNSLNAVQSGEHGSSNAVRAVKRESSKNATTSNAVSSRRVAQGVKQGSSINYDVDADYQSLIDAAVKAGDYKSASAYEAKRNAKIDGEGLDVQKTDLYTYDNNTDYQSLIDAAVKAGDYKSAAMYEAKRNTKIDMEGLDAQKTNLYSGVTKGYDSNTDYQALINEAIARGDYASAARYEDIRNKKIDGDNLDWEKTDNYNLLPGMDGDSYNTIKSDFKTSTDVNKADSEKDKARQNLESWVDTPDIVGNNVWNVLEQDFDVPQAVTEADSFLSSQLQKIQSGKTSYSDQVSGMMDKIMNREKFSYDVDKDPLFQQALASAMNNGQQAMQNTIGQASALTGGYGSTYATTAGNQAYNSFIEDAYDNLPQYYQMAMEAYQMEGDEMYRQFDALNSLDDKEYNRNITAFDATYQHRNQLYNEAYTLHRDAKADALSMSNLQLQEHSQRVSDATNLYNVTADYTDTLYAREFDKWNTEVNQALQYAQMANQNYWNSAEFTENVRQYEKNYAENVRQYNEKFAEDVRQYNEKFAEDVRQYNTTFAEDQRQFDTTFAEDVRQFDAEYAQTEKWNQADLDFKNKELAQQDRHHSEDLAYNYYALSVGGRSYGGGGGGRSYGGGGGGSYGGSGGGGTTVKDMSGSTAVGSFKANLMLPTEFNARGNSNSGERYDSYGEYVEQKIYEAEKNKSITQDEAKYLLDYYFAG